MPAERTLPLAADLPDRLARRMAEPLPGRAAQRGFAPELAYGRHHAPPPAAARQAAVVAMLYPVGDQWRMPLILRPQKMRDHAGQVALPGGMLERGESPEMAALREWREEVGHDPAGCTVLGRLSQLYVFNSNFHVTPIVAVSSERPVFQVNALEVAELIETPLAELIDERSLGRHTIERGSLQFDAPHFTLSGHCVWGATCLILAELRAVLQEAIGIERPIGSERR